MFASVGYDPILSGWSERPAAVPSTAGIPEGARSDVVVAQWNDLGSVEAILAEHPGEVAAIMCEPIAVNGGLIAAGPGLSRGAPAARDERRGACSCSTR